MRHLRAERKALGLTSEGKPRNHERMRCRYRLRGRLKSNYGLSLLDYDLMVLTQSGRCAICSMDMDNPYVDHCHDTGLARGLLCSACNFMLGHAQDRAAILRLAADYLENA